MRYLQQVLQRLSHSGVFQEFQNLPPATVLHAYAPAEEVEAAGESFAYHMLTNAPYTPTVWAELKWLVGVMWRVLKRQQITEWEYEGIIALRKDPVHPFRWTRAQRLAQLVPQNVNVGKWKPLVDILHQKQAQYP